MVRREFSALNAAGAVAGVPLRRRRSLPAISLEAMVPAVPARHGDGFTLACGVAPSPFGWLLSAEMEQGLCYLGFVGSPSRDAALALLRAQWPDAQLDWQPAAARALSDRLWTAATNRRAPLRLCVRGTRFQLEVWRALLALRPGEHISYAQLAARVGAPRAARAVGGAVGANPIAWLIPCHRVLRADGSLGGYHWGVERKRAMLAWEQQHSATPLNPIGAGAHW